MAKAQQLLDEMFMQAKTLVQKNGHSADYTAFLGRLEMAREDLNPRAVSVLAFTEEVKTETGEGGTRQFANSQGATLRVAATIEAHALQNEQRTEPGIIAQQMIADLKRCFLAQNWSSSAIKIVYNGASWAPPEQDVLSVQVRITFEYSEKYAQI